MVSLGRDEMTDGTRGEEPPEEIKELIEWWETLRRADEQVRIEMGKEILRSQAENLWALGVIGLGPHPIVVSNDLRNVPRYSCWGWDSLVLALFSRDLVSAARWLIGLSTRHLSFAHRAP